jgi:hypothetical protein
VPFPHLTSNAPDHIDIQTAWASMYGGDIPFFTVWTAIVVFP